MEGERRNGLIQGRQNQNQSQDLLQQTQKCPRCDSLNTKFCYFNNYSQSQPRYFCKECRRYWTQGGTLRNVPIGGGCRKGKRARLASSSGEDVRSVVAAPIAPARQQPAQLQSNLTATPPNVVPSNPGLGVRESGPVVPAVGLAPTMATYYPGEDGYLSSLLSNNKSLSVGSDAAGTSNLGSIPGFNVQPFSYQQQQLQIQPQQFYQMGKRERSIGAMYQRQHSLVQSGMPAGGNAYQPYWSHNIINDANLTSSVSDTSVWNSMNTTSMNANPNDRNDAGSSLVQNQWPPKMPEYDPSP